MTKGDAGQNISKFAGSSTDASPITTSLPYISYVDLARWLDYIYQHTFNAIDAYLSSIHSSGATPIGFKVFCDKSSSYNDVFICDGYRLCRAAKLLMSLGYGNFTTVVQYDIHAQVSKYFEANKDKIERLGLLTIEGDSKEVRFKPKPLLTKPSLSQVP